MTKYVLLLLRFILFTGTSIVLLSSLLNFELGRDRVGRQTELGLNGLKGFVSDDSGCLYLALQLHNRVQVYCNDGEFFYGFFVDEIDFSDRTFNGQFKLRFNSGTLEVVTPRKSYRFIDGVGISVIGISGDYYRDIPVIENYHTENILYEIDGSLRRSIHKVVGSEREVLIASSLFRWAATDFLFGWFLILVSFLGLNAAAQFKNKKIGDEENQ